MKEKSGKNTRFLKLRLVVAMATLASFAVLPSAHAAHDCAVPEPTIDRLCDGYHDVPFILLCAVTQKPAYCS
jgi:hypothetical protein